MKQRIIGISLLLCLLAPFGMAAADSSLNDVDINALDAKLNHSLVYITRDARKSILELESLLPDHNWSSLFKNLCRDIEDESNVALYEQVDQVVGECLASSSSLPSDIQGRLEKYRQSLREGKAHISALDYDASDAPAQTIIRKKCKKFCKLSVRCLTVTGALNVNGQFFINGLNLTGLTILAPVLPSATGATGATGGTGGTGATGGAGVPGIPGVGGVLGAAEFIRTIQSPNNSVAPGTAFTIDTQVFNNNPTAIVASAGAGGTVW